MDLPQPEVQEAYVTGVSALRPNTNISYICNATREGYITAGGTADEWSETPLTLTTATKLMAYFVTTQMNQPLLSLVAMLTYSFVAMSKRIIVSDDFCTMVVDAIRQDVGISMTMTADFIKQLWCYYGDVMDDLVAANLFAMWKEELPPNTLRLRIILEKTLNTGLTTLTVTVRGLSDHPSFPWDQLIELSPYASEMAVLKHAIEVVGDNRYYGYRKDLGDARGTLYKNLSYVAKELLIKVNGETALRRYAGFPRRPAQASIVNSMIEAYINRVQNYGQDPGKYALRAPCKSDAYNEIRRLRDRFISLYQH
ncbi:hypothetical protein Q1695_015845 [Nippostrongylus brasiliensis]|nr:hypothetical protein Q1695_015845 [Nippostrongylus brasiliensis]